MGARHALVLKNAHVDQGEIAARQTLQAFLAKQADQLQVGYLLVMGDVAARYLDDMHGWQADGTSLPEPPKVKRPPVIHVTHTLRMAERILA